MVYHFGLSKGMCRRVCKSLLLVIIIISAGAFADHNGFLAESRLTRYVDSLSVSSDTTGQRDNDSLDLYIREVNEWHTMRIERLKEEQGWLRLAGMYWLSEGEQMFGSGERARIRFPEGTIPEYAGIFKLEADTVSMRVAGTIEIRDERDRVVRDGKIYTPEMRRELRYRGLNWFVVKRDDQFAIRLFDDNNLRLNHFNGIDRFEVDRQWRVEADFIPAEDGTTMLIENVIGQMIDWNVAGRLAFEREGVEVSMVALGSGDRLFVPFSDATSGNETYPAGRYVYIDSPAPGEKAIIDFNYSYNPPCAINPYTTCPLPPPPNRLSFPIRAGEKHFEMYQEEAEE